MKKISALEKKLSEIPNVVRGRGRTWPLETDAMILKFCPDKGAPAVARVLGLPSQTVRIRFLFLKERIKK